MLEQAVCAGDVGDEGWAMEVLGSKSEADMISKIWVGSGTFCT